MLADNHFTLSNGIEIPQVGLGTWMIPDDAVAQVVRDALAIGYRHVDTAQAYANERGVGEGVRTSGLARDAVFVTTKLAAEHKDYKSAAEAIDESLRQMGLDHVDLMLIHSPQPWAEFRAGRHFHEGNLEAWQAMEDASKAGKIRAIGVSNFERADLENLIENGAIAPMVNQILAHIGNTPFDLIDYCRGKGVLVEAYSPVGHGAVLNNPDLAAIAGKYGVGIAQLSIRYCLQLGLLPLPKTANPAHMRSNIALDFTISEADMDLLKGFRGGTDYGEASVFPVFAKSRQTDTEAAGA
ncbi:2,5-diketo-D-gluconic acid reductase [Novosphingobium sp. PC22D]|uniref:aldo/keto reductase n=1 Tax=Novosphingobium sp. PC22D TaxID=1962403 RepID=UPI000BF1E36C|nr:aldo/keto reductase [Novosphingobium sp. PC22D]PEQ11078.1 2,5-diketo-D-gluconic acid reductase [Novosphingobium sp. PC22D]